MPQSIDAVVEERHREEGLQSHLHSNGPSSDSRHHRLRLKMPSKRRRSEVCETEEVERAGESDARYPIETRAVPSDLRAVDGEVGGDGALQTLFGEDFCGLILRSGFSCCESVSQH